MTCHDLGKQRDKFGKSHVFHGSTDRSMSEPSGLGTNIAIKKCMHVLLPMVVTAASATIGSVMAALHVGGVATSAIVALISGTLTGGAMAIPVIGMVLLAVAAISLVVAIVNAFKKGPTEDSRPKLSSSSPVVEECGESASPRIPASSVKSHVVEKSTEHTPPVSPAPNVETGPNTSLNDLSMEEIKKIFESKCPPNVEFGRVEESTESTKLEVQYYPLISELPNIECHPYDVSLPKEGERTRNCIDRLARGLGEKLHVLYNNELACEKLYESLETLNIKFFNLGASDSAQPASDVGAETKPSFGLEFPNQDMMDRFQAACTQHQSSGVAFSRIRSNETSLVIIVEPSQGLAQKLASFVVTFAGQEKVHQCDTAAPMVLSDQQILDELQALNELYVTHKIANIAPEPSSKKVLTLTFAGDREWAENLSTVLGNDSSYPQPCKVHQSVETTLFRNSLSGLSSISFELNSVNTLQKIKSLVKCVKELNPDGTKLARSRLPSANSDHSVAEMGKNFFRSQI